MSDKPEAMTCDVKGAVTLVPSYRQLEARIRELDANLDTKRDRIVELEERIAKAKEILDEAYNQSELTVWYHKAALEALEGK